MAGIAFIRLSPSTTRIIPIAFSVPLIISVWFDDKRLVWIMACCFAVIGAIRSLYIAPEVGVGNLRYLTLAMILFDVAVVAMAVHLLIDARRDIDRATQSLDVANRDLAARQEILEKQNIQLSELNQQFGRREAALQTLLAATRWDAYHAPGNQVISNICSAAIQLLGGDVVASAILLREGDALRVMGQAGLGIDAQEQPTWPLKDSHAAMVMELAQSSFVADIGAQSDLIVPAARDGLKLHSLLATPLRLGGQIAGVIEAYSGAARTWSAEDFKILEWLAAQASLAMEIISLQRELEQRRRDAVGESVRKTRFLVAISHDVRTPANAINLLSELMLRSVQDPARAAELPELAFELHQSASALTELIGDVLDVASFDSGRIGLEISEFPLEELLTREVAKLQPLAQAKALELRVTAKGNDVSVRTDRTKLARVVTNLIANAIKFTTAGSISVAWQLTESNLRISITDTGIGIPEGSREHIFDEFFQLTNPARDRSKGTGLGLAICKRLCAAIGCEIDVQSTAGNGTTFTITLPTAMVQSGSGSMASSKNPLRAQKPLNGRTILLVEDHDPTRRATARLLLGMGAEVLQADTGQGALQMLQTKSPDALLLDLMLPDIDGSEVLKFLRQTPKPSLQHIFAVSGDVTPERIAQIKDLGAEDLIPKPVDINRLVQRLRPDIAA